MNSSIYKISNAIKFDQRLSDARYLRKGSKKIKYKENFLKNVVFKHDFFLLYIISYIF